MDVWVQDMDRCVGVGERLVIGRWRDVCVKERLHGKREILEERGTTTTTITTMTATKMVKTKQSHVSYQFFKMVL